MSVNSNFLFIHSLLPTEFFGDSFEKEPTLDASIQLTRPPYSTFDQQTIRDDFFTEEMAWLSPVDTSARCCEDYQDPLAFTTSSLFPELDFFADGPIGLPKTFDEQTTEDEEFTQAFPVDASVQLSSPKNPFPPSSCTKHPLDDQIAAPSTWETSSSEKRPTQHKTNRTIRPSTELLGRLSQYDPYASPNTPLTDVTSLIKKTKFRQAIFLRFLACSYLLQGALPNSKPKWITEEEWKDLLEAKKNNTLVTVIGIKDNLLSLRISILYDELLHSYINSGDKCASHNPCIKSRFRWWIDGKVQNYLKMKNRTGELMTIERDIALPPFFRPHRYIHHLTNLADKSPLTKELSLFFHEIVENRRREDLPTFASVLKHAEEVCLKRWNQEIAKIDHQ
ncbi:MAG: hypothetical protein ACHQUC_05790 [Chlamydiales bacterium]